MNHNVIMNEDCFAKILCDTHGLVSVKEYKENLIECVAECGCQFYYTEETGRWENK